MGAYIRSSVLAYLFVSRNSEAGRPRRFHTRGEVLAVSQSFPRLQRRRRSSREFVPGLLRNVVTPLRTSTLL